MAEYYPLLAKAIAGLPNSTPEIRRAVYERARKALLGQLLSLEPPLGEADIERETDALDGAVARLEAELSAASGNAAKTPQAAAPVMPAPHAPDRAAPPPVSSGDSMITPPRRPPGASTQGAPSPSPKPSRLASSGPMPSSALPHSTKRTPHQNPHEFGEDAAGTSQDSALSRTPERSPRNIKASMAQLKATETQDGPDAESGASFDDESFTDFQKPRPEGLRVYAPQREAEESRGGFLRLWIVGGIVAVVVAIVAVAAWTLRDQPGQLAHLQTPPLITPEKSGKIVERIGGGPRQQDAQPQAEPNDGGQATAPAAAVSPAPEASDASQTIPVAQRAALLVEAPNEPNKIKTYVGTVVWRTDNVSNGAGQPLGTAVHADIDIPGDKLKAGLTLQKNMDASLPASHTMTIVFTVQADSPTGGVKQISVPQLRQDDSPTGDALMGVPVPIMENSFLIGLSRGSAETTNLELIKQRAWFDIPILLGNGRIAKLTFEKGASGTRAIEDAISAWQAQ